jgi:hypothetical protein
MEELPVAVVVAQAEQLEVWVGQVQAWLEEVPVGLEDLRCAGVCWVMLVLQGNCGCAMSNCWRCTTG